MNSQNKIRAKNLHNLTVKGKERKKKKNFNSNYDLLCSVLILCLPWSILALNKIQEHFFLAVTLQPYCR